jgi:hypothetical protein
LQSLQLASWAATAAAAAGASYLSSHTHTHNDTAESESDMQTYQQVNGSDETVDWCEYVQVVEHYVILVLVFLSSSFFFSLSLSILLSCLTIN